MVALSGNLKKLLVARGLTPQPQVGAGGAVERGQPKTVEEAVDSLSGLFAPDSTVDHKTAMAEVMKAVRALAKQQSEQVDGGAARASIASSAQGADDAFSTPSALPNGKRVMRGLCGGGGGGISLPPPPPPPPPPPRGVEAPSTPVAPPPPSAGVEQPPANAAPTAPSGGDIPANVASIASMFGNGLDGLNGGGALGSEGQAALARLLGGNGNLDGLGSLGSLGNLLGAGADPLSLNALDSGSARARAFGLGGTGNAELDALSAAGSGGAFFEDRVFALMCKVVEDMQKNIEKRLNELQDQAKAAESQSQSGGKDTGGESRNIEFEKIKYEIQKLTQMQQAMSNILNTMDELAKSAIRHIKASG